MSAKKQAEKRFEDLLSELEGIVQELEGGQVGLDEALAKYEKGIAALKACYERLSAAEKKIEILTKNPDGSFKAKPFDEEPGARSQESGEKKTAPARRSRAKVPKPAAEGEVAEEDKTLF